MAKIKETPYTAEEERDFYRRNAGGPVAMTSMTRGWLRLRHRRRLRRPPRRAALLAIEMDEWLGERQRTYHQGHIDEFDDTHTRE